MSGSPKMTNKLPLPVFFKSSAMCKSAFMRAFKHRDAAKFVELRGVGFVVERARDQHVKIRVAGFAGGGNQVGALDGAELRRR